MLVLININLSPPPHTLLEFCDFFVLSRLPEDVEMFVGNQKEIVVPTAPSFARGFRLPLEFDDVFSR
ncbi:MAG: hypothetical protein BME93_03440 [Methanosarcinales archaeon Met12]|nr:MAG: hypothetical protein BME93_03440 [Methanosarcinales archaeon Met12]